MPASARSSLVRIAAWVALLLAAGAIAFGNVSAQAPTAGASVLVLRLDGVIGPASADFFHRGLTLAQQRGARLLVVEMDTPGGLDDSMRRIIKDILSSTVPVATYVAPRGARAASAGTYILYASHIAAMAPATNLGAATPVALGGMPGTDEPEPREPTRDAGKNSQEDVRAEEKKNRPQGTGDRPAPSSARSLREKSINDAAAYIRGLAQLRGRDAKFAEEAVLRAASLSADEALKGGVIDVVASSERELLQKIDGRRVTLPSGEVTLAVANAPIETLEPDFRTRVLGVLSNPTLAMVLMMIGIYGLFVEFTSPGFGVPGVAGAIALLLALYSLQLLPVNWAGVALLALGAALMIAEIFMPSFGALGVGGIIAFIVGGMMMFDFEEHGIDVAWPVIVGLALASAAAILAFGAFALKSRGRPVVSGREDMIGAAGTVYAIEAGRVWAHVRGERWRVVSPLPLQLGDHVRVLAVEGLTLHVTREVPTGGVDHAV